MRWHGSKALIVAALVAFGAFLLVGDPYETSPDPAGETSRSLWSSAPLPSPSIPAAGGIGLEEGRLAGRAAGEAPGGGAAAGRKKAAQRGKGVPHAGSSAADDEGGLRDAGKERPAADPTVAGGASGSGGAHAALGAAPMAPGALRAGLGASGEAEAPARGRADANAREEEDESDDPSDCGSPQFSTSLLDDSVTPVESLFEQLANGFFVATYGERFNVGGNPAYVFYVPEAREGRAAMLVDKRFFVEVNGRCISGPQVLKAKLRS